MSEFSSRVFRVIYEDPKHLMVLEAPGFNRTGSRFGFHRIARFWDEDHDERVIRAAELLYATNNLGGVYGVAETKANVFIYYDPKEISSERCAEMEKILDSNVGQAAVSDAFFYNFVPVTYQTNREVLHLNALINVFRLGFWTPARADRQRPIWEYGWSHGYTLDTYDPDNRDAWMVKLSPPARSPRPVKEKIVLAADVGADG